MAQISHIHKKQLIRDKLVDAARNARSSADFPYYEEFGDVVGIWRMLKTGDVLDEISREERKMRRPDVTYVLRNRG
jgi:hypothetical protein